MIRDTLLSLAGLCLFTLGPARVPAAPLEEKPPAGIEALLAVNAALEQGREFLQRGQYQAAVKVLESRLELVDAKREYLLTLRDAYLGHIRELQQTNRAAEAETYLRRLRHLDPGALLELRPTAVTGLPTRPAVAPQQILPAAPPAPVASAPPANPRTPASFPDHTAPTQGAQQVQGANAPRPASGTPAPAEDPVVARAKIPDPFAEENSVQHQEALQLLEQAERAFQAKQYDSAGKLYELASRASPRALQGCRDRWAYCRLNSVVAAINRTDATPAFQDLEREVRQAVALAPDKFDRVGKELLDKIQERRHGGPRSEDGSGAAADLQVAVRHGAGQAGWSVAESANFRILHNQPKDVAERAAKIAEVTRVAMLRKWFGDNAGGPWNPRCDIYLHATASDYSRATGQPAGCPGHSTIQTQGQGGPVLARRIDLHCDDAHMLDAVLPHETTHVVLAWKLEPTPLPRWADEGMAVLTEPRDRIELHLRNLPKHQRDGELFRPGNLMQMAQYPEPRLVGAFYAQSVSLVDYLTNRRGPQVFAAFLKDAMRGGYEQALQRHYGINGFDDLERGWFRHAFNDRPGSTSSARVER
jgi:tetratricopeptide (TPR) repeat protein